MTKMSIREFMSLVQECQFCGQPLTTRLIGKSVPNHHPQYDMDFDGTEFYDEAQRLAAQLMKRLGDEPQISYLSGFGNNELRYYYQLGQTVRPILSIDIDTGKISGNSVENIQNVIWDHKLVLTRHCNSEICKPLKQGYVCESSPLYLERKKCAIIPTSIETEVYSIKIRDKVFSLMSSPGLKGTFLVTGGELIQELPHMPLHRLRGADVITNKIKTIITFS